MPRIYLLPLAFALLVSLLGTGCSSNRAQWVGEWMGEIDGIVRAERENDPIGVSLRRVKITIKPDMKFILTLGGMPYEGEAICSSSQCTLNVFEFMGQPLARAEADQGGKIKAMKLEHRSDNQIELVSEGLNVILDRQMEEPSE